MSLLRLAKDLPAHSINTIDAIEVHGKLSCTWRIKPSNVLLGSPSLGSNWIIRCLCESRLQGSSISVYYRDIPRRQMVTNYKGEYLWGLYVLLRLRVLVQELRTATRPRISDTMRKIIALLRHHGEWRIYALLSGRPRRSFALPRSCLSSVSFSKGIAWCTIPFYNEQRKTSHTYNT